MFTVLVSSRLGTGALHIHSTVPEPVLQLLLYFPGVTLAAHMSVPSPHHSQPRVLFRGPQSGSRLALNVTFATDMHGSVSPTLTGENELMEHTCVLMSWRASDETHLC